MRPTQNHEISPTCVTPASRAILIQDGAHQYISRVTSHVYSCVLSVKYSQFVACFLKGA
jgi:hypothetical protein